MKKTVAVISADLVSDYAELGVDQVLEQAKEYLPALETISEDIPVVKTLVAAVKAPGTISDVILGSKVNVFLYASNLSQGKIDKLKEKFSSAKREKLWKRVVLSIDTHDDDEKTKIIGKLFTALVDEYLTYDEFFKLVHATNSLNLANLDILLEIYKLAYIDDVPASLYYNFASLELLDVDASLIGATGSSGGPAYPLNMLGWKYCGIVFDNPLSSFPDLRVGDGVIYREYGNDAQPTGSALPIDKIKKRGSKYKIIDVFIANANRMILCSDVDNLPFSFPSELVPAGTIDMDIANSIVDESDFDIKERPRNLQTRSFQQSELVKHAFVVISDIRPTGCSYITPDDLIVQINDLMTRPSDDYERHPYLLDIVKIIKELPVGGVNNNSARV